MNDQTSSGVLCGGKVQAQRISFRIGADESLAASRVVQFSTETPCPSADSPMALSLAHQTVVSNLRQKRIPCGHRRIESDRSDARRRGRTGLAPRGPRFLEQCSPLSGARHLIPPRSFEPVCSLRPSTAHDRWGTFLDVIWQGDKLSCRLDVRSAGATAQRVPLPFRQSVDR